MSSLTAPEAGWGCSSGAEVSVVGWSWWREGGCGQRMALATIVVPIHRPFSFFYLRKVKKLLIKKLNSNWQRMFGEKKATLN